MEREPQPPEGDNEHRDNEQAEAAAEQERAEQIREESTRQRQHDQARLERYVEAGLNPDDAESLIEFERSEQHRPASGEQVTDDVETMRRYQPRVYVADLASLERGIQHGLWIDANQEAEQLNADVASMLESSPTIGATVWAVQVTEDFAGLDLPDYADTVLISRLGRGIAEHGAAYAAYASMVGIADQDMLDRFDDFYVGSYDSPEAWAREVGDDLEWNEHIDQVVGPMLRPYVTIDYARFARDAQAGWDVVQGIDGRTHVFMR